MLAALGCEPRSPAPPPAPPVIHSAAEQATKAQTGSEPASPDAQPVLAAPPPFDGWPPPELVLVLTGQQLGYIEPCGCTGLENQKGGLARRHTFIQELTSKRGWTVAPLDLGNQVRRFGKQSEIKFQTTAEALRTMGYYAATLGPEDLQVSASGLLTGTNPPSDQPSLFVSANLATIERTLQPRFVVFEAGGKRIGVTGVLGQQHESEIKSDELVHEPPLDALRGVCRELKQQDCDLYVLLAQAPVEEARAMAEELAIFDLVVVPSQSTVPARELDSIPGIKTKIAILGAKGMYAGVVGIFEDGKQRFRYESVPLDAQFGDSLAMLEIFANYQEQLQSLSLDERGARAKPHPSGRQFVGSEKCGECHTKAFAKWSTTPHAQATDSLVHPPNSRGQIARHFDPECLSCHVTGWNPQKFFPFESGYRDLQLTPELQHNGCENCHGPGSAHVAAESGEGNAPAELIAQRRDEMKLPLADGIAERKCLECHDDDNSPEFHHDGAFRKYWLEVAHPGKD